MGQNSTGIDMFATSLATLGSTFTAPAIATTITGTAADNETLQLTTAGTVVIGNGAAGGLVTNIDTLVLANGANTISLAMNTGISNITGGTGADSVTITELNTTQNGVITLGDGDDTLTAVTTALVNPNGAITRTLAGGNGTDTLTFAAAQTNAVSFALVSGFETVNLGAVGAGTLNLTLSNSDVRIINSTTAAANNVTITGTGAQLSALTEIRSTAAAGALNIAVTDAGATLELVSGTTTLQNTDVVSFQATGANSLQIDNTNITALGANAVVAAGTTDALLVVDTATVTDVTFDAFETIAQTGVANNNLTLNDLNVAQTVIANSGNNVITLAAAQTAGDTVNVSAGGVDTIVFDQAGTDTANTRIIGFTAGAGVGADVIDLSGIVGAGNLVTTTPGIVATGVNISGSATAAADINTAYILSGANFQINGALTQTTAGGAVAQAIINASLISDGTSRFAYFGLDNGTDTGIYRVNFDADVGGVSNTVIDAAGDVVSITLVGTIVGLADAGGLVTANLI